MTSIRNSFMRQVARRQHEWKYFTEVVEMVKAWARLIIWI